MQEALSVNEEIVDIHHAGTAMCFLKAYSAVNDVDPVTIVIDSKNKK